MQIQVCYTLMANNPLNQEIEQFERELAAQAEARHIVLQWLQAIETARRTGEELALLGYPGPGMEMSIAAMNLECKPPIEFLQRLICWPDSKAVPFARQVQN